MAGAEELKLLGSATGVSPFVVRARMALCLKGVSYEYVEEDLKNKSHLLIASNPVHNKVPVLIHNGKPICESLVIVEYIDEAFACTGPSLLPSNPYERAVARFWAANVDDKLLPSCIGILKGRTEEERAEKLKETFTWLQHLEGAFKECSKRKAFFGGDTIGYVDIALGCHLCWLEAFGRIAGVTLVDAGKTPVLHAWAERFGAAEAVKALIPEVDRVVDYVTNVLQVKWNDAAAAAAK